MFDCSYEGGAAATAAAAGNETMAGHPFPVLWCRLELIRFRKMRAR